MRVPILLLVGVFLHFSGFAQTKSVNTSARSAKVLTESAPAFNTTIHYNQQLREVKSKGAYQVQMFLQADGIPRGKARMMNTKTRKLLWEGEYFVFNRVEPLRSQYTGTATWYYPGGQKWRESSYSNGKLDGTTNIYSEQGRLSHTGEFREGALEGLWNYVDENGSQSKAYYQRFDLLHSGWEREETNGKSYVQEEALMIQSQSPDGFVLRETAPIDWTKDFLIEIEYRLKGDEFLFMFGQSNSDNYHGININKQSQLRVENAVEGMDMNNGQLFKFENSKATNFLRVFRKGNNVFVSVNGNMITSYPYTSVPGNQIGFFLPSKATLEVFQILVREVSTGPDRIIFSNDPRSLRKKGTGDWERTGTGFFVTSSGYIATSYRNVQDANSLGVVQIVNGKQQVLGAKLVASDELNDLAILKIEDPKYKQPGVIPYSFSNTSSDIGESIFTLSYPVEGKEAEVMLNNGVISSRISADGDNRFYLLSAPLSNTNTGSPVIDRGGRLIGVSTSKDGGNHAIKSFILLNMIESLPNSPKLPSSNILRNKPLKDQVKLLQKFTTIIVRK